MATKQKRRFIHPKGFENLVAGICRQASEDYMKHPPGSIARVGVERFFRSDYFAVLTQLDGEAILRDLAKAYNHKTRRQTYEQYSE